MLYSGKSLSVKKQHVQKISINWVAKWQLKREIITLEKEKAALIEDKMRENYLRCFNYMQQGQVNQ